MEYCCIWFGLLYNGLSRASTKFSILESAFRTLYGNIYVDQLKSLSKGYVDSKIACILFMLFNEGMVTSAQEVLTLDF